MKSNKRKSNTKRPRRTRYLVEFKSPKRRRREAGFADISEMVVSLTKKELADLKRDMKDKVLAITPTAKLPLSHSIWLYLKPRPAGWRGHLIHVLAEKA